jgi:hypothetical protein
MKGDKSFTELLKTLISEYTNKGDPKTILAFLNANNPLSEESARAISGVSKKGRKGATARSALS